MTSAALGPTGGQYLALPDMLPAGALNRIGGALLCHRLPTYWTWFPPHRSPPFSHCLQHSTHTAKVRGRALIESIGHRIPGFLRCVQFVAVDLNRSSKGHTEPRLQMLMYSKRSHGIPKIAHVCQRVGHVCQWVDHACQAATKCQSTEQQRFPWRRAVATKRRVHLDRVKVLCVKSEVLGRTHSLWIEHTIPT